MELGGMCSFACIRLARKLQLASRVSGSPHTEASLSAHNTACRYMLCVQPVDGTTTVKCSTSLCSTDPSLFNTLLFGRHCAAGGTTMTRRT